MTRLAIIGAGKWGINHVRTANALLGLNLVTVCDSRESARQRVAEIAPGARFVTRIEEVSRDPDIDGVVIATPAGTHYEITRSMLTAGKACLVEKPITLASAQARELVAISRDVDRALMVGHVLLYHPAVLEMKRRIDQGLIGRMQYIYSNRLNLGTIRSEENILWSFAPHDIAIIQHIVGRKPLNIDTKGATFLQDDVEDTTITHLTYPGNVHAHVFVSWLHPFKEQRLVVIGHRGMIVFEDTAPTDKLRFYPKGFDAADGGLRKFDGEYMTIPYTPEEPLVAEHRHFYECVEKNQRPITDGAHALQVLEILEEAQGKLRSAYAHQ